MVSADWGEGPTTTKSQIYPMDVLVEANDRQGLLRDISDVLSREQINVIAVNTRSKAGKAHMRFTVEVGGVPALNRALQKLRGVDGVDSASRA